MTRCIHKYELFLSAAIQLLFLTKSSIPAEPWSKSCLVIFGAWLFVWGEVRPPWYKTNNQAKFARLDDEITPVQMNLVTEQNLLGWTMNLPTLGLKGGGAVLPHNPANQ